MQSEYSIFSRAIEVDVIPAWLEVGASLVAYSTLDRAMPTGRLIEAVASAKPYTSAQIALAWVIGRGAHLLALTGTTKLENLIAKLGACDLKLSPAEPITLDALAARVLGGRYDTAGRAGING